MGRRATAAARKRRNQIYGLVVALLLFTFYLFHAWPTFTSAEPAPSPPALSSPAPVGNADVARRDAVRNATLHAWTGYKTYAWGKDELRPVTRDSTDWLGLGCTIVDALDTLWIMGLTDQFEEARSWVATELHFTRDAWISFFETTIRMVGGLLSAFDLSEDPALLDKAKELADILVLAFDSPSGLPRTSINLALKQSRNPSWNGQRGVLAEMGSVQLEFSFLSCLTEDPKYGKKAKAVFEILTKLKTDIAGLYPVFVETESSTPRFSQSQVTLGALGDSFYEYLLKYSVQTGDQKWYEEWVRSAEAIKSHLIQKSTPSGFTYIAELVGTTSLQHKMDHLVCFAGGMFILGSDNGANQAYLDIGLAITETCHQTYTQQITKIGPEIVFFTAGSDFETPATAHHYLLRPETFESYFYAWRYTHDEKWREYGWEAFQAIEKYCKTEVGYSGIRDVTVADPAKDDLQQSFFLAETLKYLYLLFADDSVIPLDRYVFNTEAHPFSYPLECNI